MKEEFTVRPIAHIRTDFKEKFGIPRQSGRVEGLVGRILFLPEYQAAEALRGIEGFSHLWLLFDFSKAHKSEFSPTVRPPRLGGNERVGVFASRSPFRPNPIGLSVVKLIKIEKTENGLVLVVEGADLLDGTPILDIKPYLPHVDAIKDAIGGYADEVNDYALEVVFPDEYLSIIPLEKQTGLIGCLREDPRPSYQEDPTRIYHMLFAEFDVHFTVQNGVATVVGVTEQRGNL